MDTRIQTGDCFWRALGLACTVRGPIEIPVSQLGLQLVRLERYYKEAKQGRRLRESVANWACLGAPWGLGALGPLDKKALALKADVRCNQRISNTSASTSCRHSRSQCRSRLEQDNGYCIGSIHGLTSVRPSINELTVPGRLCLPTTCSSSSCLTSSISVQFQECAESKRPLPKLPPCRKSRRTSHTTILPVFSGFTPRTLHSIGQAELRYTN